MRNLFEFLKKYNYWFVFVLLEVVSLVLMFQYNSYQGSVWFSSANYISGMTYEADSKISAFMNQGAVNKELTERNLFLEREVAILRAQLTDERIKHDSTYVDRGVDDILSQFRLIPAKVVGNSVDKTDNFITIDKGLYDGVHADMGVACGNGVVGVVYMASGHYAVVIPVLSSKSNISCAIQNRGYFGYLHWKDSSMFPPGIMVGKVVKESDSEDGLSYRLEVKLSTDFGRLRDVCVIDDSAVRERLNLLRQAVDSIKPQRNQ